MGSASKAYISKAVTPGTPVPGGGSPSAIMSMLNSDMSVPCWLLLSAAAGPVPHGRVVQTMTYIPAAWASETMDLMFWQRFVVESQGFTLGSFVAMELRSQVPASITMVFGEAATALGKRASTSAEVSCGTPAGEPWQAHVGFCASSAAEHH